MVLSGRSQLRVTNLVETMTASTFDGAEGVLCSSEAAMEPKEDLSASGLFWIWR